MTILDQLSLAGIIPVVKIEKVEQALPLAKALLQADLNAIEITFRTSAAAEVIRTINQHYPEMLIGAGTVLTRQQVDQAIEAGAQFIVTPGFNPDTVAYCIEKKIPIIPGCSSPTDIEAALSFDLTTVKFFPAEQLGGIATIKALSGPYSQVKFIATGGINASNFKEYLAVPKVAAIAGSWMVAPELLNNGQFDVIYDLSKQAIQAMLDFKIESISLSTQDPSEHNVLKEWTTCLNNQIEFQEKAINRGIITISTPDVKRALHFLQRHQIDPRKDSQTATPSSAGIDFNSIAGFDIKLIQR